MHHLFYPGLFSKILSLGGRVWGFLVPRRSLKGRLLVPLGAGLATLAAPPVQANLTPLWGFWTVLRFSDLYQAKYLSFLPFYSIFYGCIIATSLVILRRRIPALKCSELLNPILASTVQSTSLGFFLSFVFYFFIKNSYYGFFDPERGLFALTRGRELCFGITWAIFLSFFSFIIAFSMEKRALYKAFWEKDWRERGISTDQIDRSCLYTTGAYHIFFMLTALLVSLHRGDLSIHPQQPLSSKSRVLFPFCNTKGRA